MNYTYNSLTGSVLLRADSHSQKTEIETEDSTKSLINEKQFWGSKEKEGLYYDYDVPGNVFGYTVSCEGWNDYAERPTEKMSIQRTKEWIDDTILKSNQKQICVIQGYAGCGKTTFVHSILRRFFRQGNNLRYYNFYIGHVKNALEDVFISTSIMTKLISQITVSLQANDGMMIYEKFVELFEQDLSQLSPILDVHFAPIFYSKNDASLYELAKDIYNNRNMSDIDKYIKKYNVQIKNAYYAKASMVRVEREKVQSEQYLVKDTLEILLLIDYIWRCAVYLIRDYQIQCNQIIVYDNLDIIDNHRIVADFIDTIRSVLINYMEFRNSHKLDLPAFKVIIVVRKITYASISKFVEVGCNEMNQTPPDVDFLDISNFYIAPNILKHKAKILKRDIDAYIPKNAECRASVVYFLDEILKIPNELFFNIKLAELFNHNIRACTNMMEQVIQSVSYKEYFLDNSLIAVQRSDKCKESIWIHLICKILKKEKVLDSLGYNLSDSEKVNCPTTLSRLILTYLSNKRLGYIHNVQGFITTEVPLREITKALEKIPFGVFNRQSKWSEDIVPELEKNYKKENIHEQIVHNISKMLQRNDAIEEIELWRRPIYYTRNAFLLGDISLIKKNLLDQINNSNLEDSNITNFCITDEGYTFIERIATHFEFYSVRYNNQLAKPICCILDRNEMDGLIERVYSQVEKCAIKQVWLMDFYLKKQNVNKNLYLNEWFHPRTEHLQPQLHIVRTIYDHINYLSDYREYLFKVCKNNDKIFNPLNECLVKWVGKYLNLYRSYFYDRLKNTDGEYNNGVWLDLKYLYWIVFKDEKKRGVDFLVKRDSGILTMNRKRTAISRNKQDSYDSQNRITDKDLLNNSMLIE